MSHPVHIVCPSCGGVNRVPVARLEHGPKCGKCHDPLFTGHSVELTSSNFHQHVTRSNMPVVVDFWAPWCGPCKSMAPAFEQAAGQLEPQARLAKLNTEAESTIGGQFGIRSIPTLVIFRQGREVARQSGAMGAAAIVQWVRAQV